MSMPDDRYSRQTALFGAEGQARLAASRVAIIGVGGLGCHVAQQVAYAGVKSYVLVDPDTVEPSNLNRLVGAVEADAAAAAPKVAVAARMILSIQPEADIDTLAAPLADARPRLNAVDVLFGCLDDDSARLELTIECGRRDLSYFDLATDTGDDGSGAWFGGRVLFSGRGERCPSCMDLLDQRSLGRARMTRGQREEEARIYGIEQSVLAGTGPAVISLNGVVASLAVTEFIKWRTGLGAPAGLLTYRGERGVVRVSTDSPAEGCFYCASWPSRRPDQNAS